MRNSRWLILVAACGGLGRESRPAYVPHGTATQVLDQIQVESNPPISARMTGVIVSNGGYQLGGRVIISLPDAAFPHPGLESLDGKPHIVTLEIAEATSRTSGLLQITGFHVIDTTPDTPIDVLATAKDAEQRWATWIEHQRGEIGHTLDEAARASDGRAFGAETTGFTDGVSYRWALPDRVLVITYARRTTRSSTLEQQVGTSGCDKYRGDRFRAPAPCPPPIPAHVERHVRAYHADAALVLGYDATGKLVTTQEFAPHPVPALGRF
ncbi:MAG: hypothetical protein JWO36_1610 [Myxococcales bacterium]|nr:hypothetical protein [Myxococcales bacterium]